jgi:hypothetical protein
MAKHKILDNVLEAMYKEGLLNVIREKMLKEAKELESQGYWLSHFDTITGFSYQREADRCPCGRINEYDSFVTNVGSDVLLSMLDEQIFVFENQKSYAKKIREALEDEEEFYRLLSVLLKTDE